MCGIVGFLDRSSRMRPEERWTTIQRMTGTLRHRGPDDVGCWMNCHHGIALGHRRLSIIDLSSTGHQPMHSVCGRYVTVFNGEVYNFRALRDELQGSGQWFRGESDTEVMLAAISRWGLEKALQKFNGMFAFALWDSQEKLLHLVRDRLGEKPLYYGWAAGRVMLFASELKALRQHPAFQAEVDRDVVALYLRHNYIPAPYSIYKGIYKLPPGTILTLPNEQRSFLVNSYWSLRHAAESGVASPFCGTVSEAVDELESLLEDSVRLRMESDVPLGAFLSGGIDSSVVVALAQARSHRPMKSFTIGFCDAHYDESPHARAVAHHLGTEHTELRVTPEQTMAVIGTLPLLYDEPFADSSQIPTFLVSRLARASVKVSLSGDGGDELFGGYGSYLRWQGIERRMQWIPKALKPSLATVASRLAAAIPDWPVAFVESFLPRRLRPKDIAGKLRKLAQVLQSEKHESWYRAAVSYWMDPESVLLGAHEPPTAFTDCTQWAQLEDFVQVMMYLDTVTYLPDDILVKVDRASMGVSLEARVPMLDHRIVEFAWRLPLSFKIGDGVGKKLLRRLLHQYVPKAMVDRPKKGFAIPVGDWLRGPLRPWAETLLSESRLHREAFFCADKIRRKWNEHLSGSHDWQPQLWGVLMFQAWLENQKSAEALKTEQSLCPTRTDFAAPEDQSQPVGFER